MKTLINITEREGESVVSARELHKVLEVKTDFTDWCKRMFEYGFVENIDFTSILGKSTGGRPSMDYALTLDTAKEISMLQRTDQGKQARQYFIEVEKKAKKPMDILDVMASSIQMLKDQKEKLSEFDKRLLQVEAKATTRPSYYTIAGYGTILGVSVNMRKASALGRKATKICKERGYETDKVNDPRFGYVKSYPKKVLEQVFEAELV